MWREIVIRRPHPKVPIDSGHGIAALLDCVQKRCSKHLPRCDGPQILGDRLAAAPRRQSLRRDHRRRDRHKWCLVSPRSSDSAHSLAGPVLHPACLRLRSTLPAPPRFHLIAPAPEMPPNRSGRRYDESCDGSWSTARQSPRQRRSAQRRPLRAY